MPVFALCRYWLKSKHFVELITVSLSCFLAKSKLLRHVSSLHFSSTLYESIDRLKSKFVSRIGHDLSAIDLLVSQNPKAKSAKSKTIYIHGWSEISMLSAGLTVSFDATALAYELISAVCAPLRLPLADFSCDRRIARVATTRSANDRLQIEWPPSRGRGRAAVTCEIRQAGRRSFFFVPFLSRHSSSRRRRPIAVWTVVCERVPQPDRTDVLSAYSP